jgi:hypothetical protein
MVWSQLAGIRTPPIVATDFLYIRFIGDRIIGPYKKKILGRYKKKRSKREAWNLLIIKLLQRVYMSVNFQYLIYC